MDMLDAIKSRRSIRKYLNKPIEFDKILAIIEAGTHAPNSGNLQNWRFVVVTDSSTIKKLPDFCAGQECACAPVIIIACSNDEPMKQFYGVRGERLYSIQNLAAAIENMLLTAHALDLGACWIGAFDEEKIRDIFNIPGTVRAHAIISLGYPDEVPAPKNLRSINDVIFFNKYGNTIRDPSLTLRNYSAELEKTTQAAQDAISKGKSKIRQHVDKVFNKNT